MTTSKREQLISSDWSTARVTNALKNEEAYLESLDPFADIDLLRRKPSVEQDDSNILQIDEDLLPHLSSEDENDYCESECEFENRNVFDVIAQDL